MYKHGLTIQLPWILITSLYRCEMCFWYVRRYLFIFPVPPQINTHWARWSLILEVTSVHETYRLYCSSWTRRIFSMGLFCYCFSSTVNSYLTVSRINWTITLSRDTTYSYSRWHQDPIDVKIWSQAKPNRSSIRNIFTFSVRTRLCVFLGSLKIHAWSVFKDLG